MSDLAAAWQRWVGILEIIPAAASLLNGPCPIDVLRDAERALGFAFPESLAELLQLNNGQKLDGKGLFKSPSGWDCYRRQFFLDAESIPIAYRTFIEDEFLLKELGDQEVPFASERIDFAQGEVFTVNWETQRVSLIWTETYDPWNPPEWQVARFDRGKDLAAFVEWQRMMYG
jgi:hypothetical protein